jgi:hypothetical protein
VSAFGDAMKALKDVILMQASIERLGGDFERLSDDVRGVKQAVVDIDRRVARIEGVMEGYQRASAAPRRSRLPKK